MTHCGEALPLPLIISPHPPLALNPSFLLSFTLSLFQLFFSLSSLYLAHSQGAYGMLLCHIKEIAVLPGEIYNVTGIICGSVETPHRFGISVNQIELIW